MIVEKDFLSKLKDFDLNTYESKLWIALLSRGVSTAGELSDIANVPRSRSYDVLGALEKKGFIITKVGKPIKYVAVPPEEVIERVKKRIKQDSEKHLKLITGLKTSGILSELNTLHSKGIELIQPLELSGSIKDQQNIQNHLESRLKSAKKSITIMTTKEGFSRKAALLLKLFKKPKGIKIKIAASAIKENPHLLNELSSIADIRQTTKQARFCIIDGKEVTFMLLNDKNVHPSYDLAIWVNSGFFAQTLGSLFNSEWEQLKR